jgi:hypothetical protein
MRQTSRSKPVETSRTSTIERVWLDELRPRAGRTVPLKVLTRSYRGEDKISTVPIEIPANLSGSRVAARHRWPPAERHGAARSAALAAAAERAQMIRVLNDTRRNNRIYIRLLNGKPGAVVNGEALTSLPPPCCQCSKAIATAAATRRFAALPSANGRLTMDSAVSGSRVLSIDVEAGAGGR